MRVTILAVVLLVGLIVRLECQAPIVVSAYAGRDSLLFDAAADLPWESWVPAGLRLAALRADSARRHELAGQRSEFGFTELPFAVPVPRGIADRFYYLLDAAGPRAIRPTGLLGTLRLEWTGAGAELDTIHVFGQVVVAGGPAGEGGFVLISDRPLEFATEPSRATADQLLAPQGGTYEKQGTSFWQVVTQYRVRVSAPVPATWIWVRWRPDTEVIEGGCERRFSLFAATPGSPVAMVAATNYLCDV